MIERNCNWCSAPFKVQPSALKRGRGRFCSATCRNKFGRSLRDIRGAKNPAWKGGVWRENTNKAAAIWNKNNPEKRRAHHAVQHEIKMNRMERGPCTNCGAEKNVDAHHHDYEQPLVVTWLCRRCHLIEHRQ